MSGREGVRQRKRGKQQPTIIAKQTINSPHNSSRFSRNNTILNNVGLPHYVPYLARKLCFATVVCLPVIYLLNFDLWTSVPEGILPVIQYLFTILFGGIISDALKQSRNLRHAKELRYQGLQEYKILEQAWSGDSAATMVNQIENRFRLPRAFLDRMQLPLIPFSFVLFATVQSTLRSAIPILYRIYLGCRPFAFNMVYYSPEECLKDEGSWIEMIVVVMGFGISCISSFAFTIILLHVISRSKALLNRWRAVNSAFSEIVKDIQPTNVISWWKAREFFKNQEKDENIALQRTIFALLTVVGLYIAASSGVVFLRQGHIISFQIGFAVAVVDAIFFAWFLLYILHFLVQMSSLREQTVRDIVSQQLVLVQNEGENPQKTEFERQLSAIRTYLEVCSKPVQILGFNVDSRKKNILISMALAYSYSMLRSLFDNFREQLEEQISDSTST